VTSIGSPKATIHRPERFLLQVSKSADIPDALERAYGTSLRLKLNSQCNTKAPMRLERTTAGVFAIDEVEIRADFEASPDPLDKVVATWVTRGKLSGRCGRLDGAASVDDITMVTQPDLRHDCSAEDLAATSVLIDQALVASVAAGVPLSEAPLPLRFSSFAPVDARAAQRWKETVLFVQNCVLADDAIATPLVLGHVGRLLAAVTLAVFPQAAANPSPWDRTDSHPVLLRKAMDFIDANLHRDIGLADIADAVHVTPRAVQYMFRRHLDSTPSQWLRDMRMRRARTDLSTADPTHTTVTEIAARWGFAHPGRFAALYRQTFGESPHETLQS
jgi:AraC-like DNA-binding protein